MPKSLNRVTLLGHVGKQPELKYTPQGTPVAKFSMATSSSYKKDGEWVEKTEWHNLVLWAKVAEVAAEHVNKGDKIMVEGRIETRSWDDKDSGVKKYMTEIVVHDLFLLGKKKEGNGEGNGGNYQREGFDQTRSTSGRPVTEDDPVTDSDIPF